jgi:hypothetical protein
MEKSNQIKTVRVHLSADEDGRRAARIVALSMGILFSLIFALHALLGLTVLPSLFAIADEIIE